MIGVSQIRKATPCFGRVSLFCLLLALAGCATSSARRGTLEETKTGVRMVWDGRTLWNLEIETPEGRPYFHPLALPGGRTFTDLRPQDHVWHLGAWFSWKFINGVNYWEPADAKRQGCEPEGRTRVVAKRLRRNGLACRIDLKLDYGPRAAREPVLLEDRTITITPPNASGGYAITVRHHFTARADVLLDRTPPHGDIAKGRWGGGYAGPTLRLEPSLVKVFQVKGVAGGTSPASVTAKERSAIALRDPATGEGLVFTQLQAPTCGAFYLWPDKRMINASPVYDAPLALKAGETLDLAYRLDVQ